VKLREALRGVTAQLSAVGIETPRLEARLIISSALGRDDANLIADEFEIEQGVLRAVEQAVSRRSAHEPLAYILGRKEFWSLSFEVGPGVLVPRPETETLLEQLVQEFPERERPIEIVDYGTGSGCLLVAALALFSSARGLGIDRSAEALQYARRNAVRHGVKDRASFEVTDWTSGSMRTADAILTNPPYVRTEDLAALAPEVARYEPVAALDGGADGLDAYRSLGPSIVRALKPNGVALFEIGTGQADEVGRMLQEAGLETVRIVPDLAGIPRCVVTRRAC
jgi:release factor glutamine methyltransferase